MIKVRKASERGYADHGWLKSWHSFSFADYFDPNHHNFRALRVINEDIVSGGRGFSPHPHKDMEIITYVLEGALEHKDNTGGSGIIRPGIVQRMSAGTGVIHSEFNHSKTSPVHLYQIWIMPKKNGVTPSYEEKSFEEDRGRLVLIASPDGAMGSVTINADVLLYSAHLNANQIYYNLKRSRAAWLQVVKGSVILNETKLEEGDGASVEGDKELRIEGKDAKILLFDLGNVKKSRQVA